MKYFQKTAKRRSQADKLFTGLSLGAAAGAASTFASHPIEHKLYGRGKGFFKHLGARLGKGMLASAAAFGTYHYLSKNQRKINIWTKNIGRRSKKYTKYFN